MTSGLPPSANRVFSYDVFLSHNRSDSSAGLAQDLAAAGVVVWYDEIVDLRDRRVRPKIVEAIRNSRYIVVCIGSTFRDSSWVRAEYEPGLQFETKHGISRVLVAATDNSPKIPQHLANSPTYNVVKGELAWLAECLLNGNASPLQPLAPLPRAPAIHKSELTAAISAVVRETSGSIDAPSSSDIDLVARVAAEWAKRRPEEGWKFLFKLADVCDVPSIATLRADHFCKRMLRALALRVCESERIDERADALRILLSLARQERSETAAADVISFLEHEDREEIMKLAIDWLKSSEIKPRAWTIDSLRLPILRSSTAFKPSANGPLQYAPPRRVWQLLKSNALLLTEDEILNLAYQRLEYLMSDYNNRYGTIKIFLREELDDLMDYASRKNFETHILSQRVADNINIATGILVLLEKLIEYSSIHWKTLPFGGDADDAVDYILHPLLLLRQIDGLAKRCSHCYLATCALISAVGTPITQYQAEIYRQLLEKITLGADYKTADKECEIAFLERLFVGSALSE